MKVLFEIYVIFLMWFLVMCFIWIGRPSNEWEGASFLRNREGIVFVLKNVVHGFLYLSWPYYTLNLPLFLSYPLSKVPLQPLLRPFDFYMNSWYFMIEIWYMRKLMVIWCYVLILSVFDTFLTLWVYRVIFIVNVLGLITFDFNEIVEH